jgi:UDP-MurNAc hydroxylase
MAEPTIEFVNHAAFVVDGGQGVRLLSDPWLDGLVFNRGWKLLSPSRFSEADFGSITHLWISHEHPDHFHPPTLKTIPATARARITVLSQSNDLAAGREVQAFCRTLGFREVIALPADRHVELGPDVSILSRHHMWGDSWCHLALRGAQRSSTLFNANDCEWETPEVGEKLFAEIGPVDVLLMQFSYASWYRDAAACRREADRLIERLVMMTRVSGARFVIPFASFISFCHVENRRLNEEMNTIHRAVEAVGMRTSARPIALYPGDRWTIGDSHDPASALGRYERDYERMKEAPPVVVAAPLTLQELRLKSSAFWSKNRGSASLPLPPLDLRVFVSDWGQAILWTGAELTLTGCAETDCDIGLAADSLAFLLDTRWGMGTLGINGRYQLPDGSRFQSLQEIELAIVRALGRRNWLIAGDVDTTAYGNVPETS